MKRFDKEPTTEETAAFIALWNIISDELTPEQKRFIDEALRASIDSVPASWPSQQQAASRSVFQVALDILWGKG